MDDKAFGDLLGNWELIRDSTSLTSQLLSQAVPAEQLAVSLLAGRREYWQALVGSAAFAAASGLDLAAFEQQLATWPDKPVDSPMWTYFAGRFDGAPDDAMAAAEVSVRLVGPKIYARAVQLVSDFGVCRIRCAHDPDPDCISKCLRKPSHEGFEDEPGF